MKIVIAAGNFFPEKTGIGKYSGEMAAWLAAQGHQVTVLTGSPYYPEWKVMPPYQNTRYRREEWQGVQVHRVPHYVPTVRISSLRRMLVDLTMWLASFPFWLKLLLSRDKPDVILAVCPPLLSGVLPALVSAIRGVPWIYHIQDYQVDAALQLEMLKRGVFAKVLLLIERFLIARATVVSSITPAMVRFAQQKGAAPDKCVELPNWSNISQIFPIDRLTPFRQSLKVRADQLLVMYAGAMGKKQGLEIVLDVAERLKEDPAFHFVMIGSGSDALELQALAERRELPNVSFVPLQPVEMLNEVLGSADIHLVVQRSGAADLVMPSKLTNILASGRPTLATADPGTALWDVVEGADTGLVVQPEDSVAFADALLRLKAEPDRRERCAGKARLYAQANLDIDTVIGRFESQLVLLTQRRLCEVDRDRPTA